jgi:hypothetical protein
VSHQKPEASVAQALHLVEVHLRQGHWLACKEPAAGNQRRITMPEEKIVFQPTAQGGNLLVGELTEGLDRADVPTAPPRRGTELGAKRVRDDLGALLGDE